MKDELLRMNELIEKLTKKQRNHEAKIEKELSDSKGIINHLSAVNNKMEDEIEIIINKMIPRFDKSTQCHQHFLHSVDTWLCQD